MIFYFMMVSFDVDNKLIHDSVIIPCLVVVAEAKKLLML